MPIHVAILKKQYANLILSGQKTIESRLTVRPIAPFNTINPGERIFFKVSSGPFVATAVAEKVVCHENLTPALIRQLQVKCNKHIRGPAEYWNKKANCKYATIIHLRDVCPTPMGPPFPPSHGPAWFVFDQSLSPAAFDVTITRGAIENSYVRIPKRTHTFPVEHYASATPTSNSKVRALPIRIE